MIRTVAITIVFISFLSLTGKGQMIQQNAQTDSVSNALVPVLGYSSNEGVIGGAIYNRYDYRGNVKPFRSYLKSSALISSKGFIEVEARYEQTRSFGRRIRSIYNANFQRYTKDIFFGIGNETDFSKSRWEDEYYFFESVGMGFSYKARKPIYKMGRRQLDLFGGLGFEYQKSNITSQQSSFADRMPNGREGGWVNFLNTGMIWENRDSEFDPHHGNRATLEWRYSPDLISSYALTSIRMEFRQYFYLFNWLTVANRLEARQVFGDIPYWEYSTLGGENNLRGYPLNRFRGNASLAYTMELRGWIFKFPQFLNLKLGGQLFTDVGRVFTDQDDINDLFEGYKQTVGFGGAMSIFNPDFILRGEIGFSEDVSRIYVGVGYLF